MPAYRSSGYVFDFVDPTISPDIRDLSFSYQPSVAQGSIWSKRTVGPPFNRDQGSMAYQNLAAHRNHSFKLDYYYRVHSSTRLIELGTVAAPQIRSVVIWNAWPDRTAILEGVVLSEVTGIEVTGPTLPNTMNPLEENTYQAHIDSLGPPQINTTLHFDFTSVPDPLPTLILGQRAVKFDLIPEVGVKETWEWLTDTLVSSDGTEQRISLRGGMPRSIMNFDVVLLDADAIRRFQNDLLTANNSFWVPEWQYATRITQSVGSGTSRLYYAPDRTDIRAGEYALLILPDSNSSLVQVSSLTVDGCLLSTPLTIAIPEGSTVSPGSVALIKDASGMTRRNINHHADINLEATFQRRRATLAKPGSTSPVTLWAGVPVLDSLPLGDDPMKYDLRAELEVQDNSIGEIKYYKVRDYPKTVISREYLLSRTPITTCHDPFKRDLDYWKHFFDYARGSQRKFWLPTFRDDFTLLAPVAMGASSILVREKEYAQKVFSAMPTHRRLYIMHETGVHLAQVTAAIEESGGSRLVFTPSLPLVFGANSFKRISYLLPVKLLSDSIEFEHFHSESTVRFSVRSAEI